MSRLSRALLASVVAVAAALLPLIGLAAVTPGLDELSDLMTLPLLKQYAGYEATSHDMTGGNWDCWNCPPGQSRVLVDLVGPGMIDRIWVTGCVRGDTFFKFFFDGEATPRIECSTADFFDGKVPPFGPPLVGATSGGFDSYYPIPYAKSLRLQFENRGTEWVGSLYWHVGYRTYPESVTIRSFDPAAKRPPVVPESLIGAPGVIPVTKDLALGPGQTQTIFDQQGPGTVVGLVVDLNSFTPELLRETLIRAYWDGETDPSVLSPFGDFFGQGFPERDFQSAMISVKGGHLECLFPMPFTQTGRIVLENTAQEGTLRGSAQVYYARKVPDGVFGNFHAWWDRADTVAGQPHLLLQAIGRGHYVGTSLAMQQPAARNWIGFLEGDEMAWVDGEETPSWNGTGTEDYFGGGWYFAWGPFAAPFHGCPYKEPQESRIGAYRWHLPDPITFARSLKMVIEHGGGNDVPGCDYTSVAYWYQTEPHQLFPPIPSGAALLPKPPAVPPPRLPGGIEGEDLVAKARVKGPGAEQQDLDGTPPWSGGSQLWFPNREQNNWVEVPITVEKDGDYRVSGFFTTAGDYGIFQLLVDGASLGQTVDLYTPGVRRTDEVTLGTIHLTAGEHWFRFQVVDKNEKSVAYMFGLDVLFLRPSSE